jgi:hypothetical protein
MPLAGDDAFDSDNVVQQHELRTASDWAQGANTNFHAPVQKNGCRWQLVTPEWFTVALVRVNGHVLQQLVLHS